MKQLLKHIAIIACLLSILMLSSCAEKDTPTPGIIAGFSQLGAESGWRVGNTKDVEAAAQNAGIQLMMRNAEQMQENQIKAIRSFIAYQVDVIILAPIVEQGWETVLTEAKDAGIPVLLIDRDIDAKDTSLYAGAIGSDFLAEGRRAGEFLMKKTEGMKSVRIVEITGTENSTPTRERTLGFRDALGGDPRFDITISVSGDFLRSKGRECMENILRETRDIDMLYSHNDAMTLGAIEAIEAVGLAPGKDIIIITVDGEQGAIDLLKLGKINCIVECNPMIGGQIMELVKKLAAGEAIPKKTYSTERVFTEWDEDLMSIPPRGY